MRIQDILPNLTARRRGLAMRAAQQGIVTDPSVTIELDNLNKFIAALLEARDFLRAGWEVEPENLVKIQRLGSRLGLPIDRIEL